MIDLTADPLGAATLFAVTLQEGIFKSTDGGVSWRHLSGGLPATLIAPGLTLDPRQPQILFLANPAGGVYRSRNGGASWILAGLRGVEITDVAVDPTHSSVVYAAADAQGVFRSVDGGGSWRFTASGSPHAMSLLAAGPALLAAGSTGISVSLDRGASWQASRGLSATQILGLAVSEEDPSRIYAASLSGLWKTARRGMFWHRLPTDVDGLHSVTVAPNTPGTVYAGFVKGFVMSTDHGSTWSRLPRFYSCADPDWIVVDPSQPARLYSGGDPLDTGCALQPGACESFRSIDGGQSWSCIGSGILGSSAIAIDPFAPSHLSARSRGGLYRSVDSGDSWSLFAPGIEAWAVVFHSQTPGLVFAALQGAVGRSIDGGATWELHRDGLPAQPPLLFLAVSPTDPSRVYAATRYEVYRSVDGGVTWAATPSLAELEVSSLAVDPISPDILYAATWNGGVMMLQLDE